MQWEKSGRKKNSTRHENVDTMVHIILWTKTENWAKWMSERARDGDLNRRIHSIAVALEAFYALSVKLLSYEL